MQLLLSMALSTDEWPSYDINGSSGEFKAVISSNLFTDVGEQLVCV